MYLMLIHYSHLQQSISSKLSFWAFDIEKTMTKTFNPVEQTYDLNLTNDISLQGTWKMITKWIEQIYNHRRSTIHLNIQG
jgi:hypothetical protein